MGNKGTVFNAPTAATGRTRSRGTGLIIFIVIALLVGGGFWYYFFGQKPRVVLTVGLGKQDYSERNGLWSLASGEVVVLGNGEVKLLSIADRTVKWSAKVPDAVTVDPKWRASINARFVRLHQWAEELNQKRTSLKTPKDTKDFNDEAAKYQAELAAVRAELSRPPVPQPAAETSAAKPPAPAPAAAQKKTEPEKPKQASTPEMQLLEQRIKRRGERLKLLAGTIKTKKTSAATDIQRAAVAEDEQRHTALLAEQKGDEDELARLKGAVVSAPPKPAEPAKEEPEPEDEVELVISEKRPFAGSVGDLVWVIDGEHMVAFDRPSGALKSDVPLAGPCLKAWSRGEEIFVVAAAGAEARQITRIKADTGPVSLYVSAGPVENAFGALEQGGMKPNVQKVRTEFIGPALRADIRLTEEKLTSRDALKAGSDKALEETAGNAVTGSAEELAAVSKLIANDAQRLAGTTKEWVDGSTYEVSLRHAFDSSVSEWKGTLTGRVHLFSTPSYTVLAAGMKLLVLDSSNKQMWEAPLGAPVPVRDDEESDATCLESGDRLYFADGAFLTAFEKATGNVLWRVPSIGIQKLQVDADENLYVHTRNLATESLTYALDESFQDADPITMKINAADGAIQWQVEKYQDLWVSGNHVYVLLEAQNPADLQNRVFDASKVPEARVKLYKLNRRNGNSVWEWFQPRRPRAVHADKKHVAILFGEELQLIHSIAL
jgi:hypothetical protein